MKNYIPLAKGDLLGSKKILFQITEYRVEKTEKETLKDVASKENTLILIGPEGGFSTNEMEMALKNQFKTVSLGTSRLRTETAGIVAAHTINIFN